MCKPEVLMFRLVWRRRLFPAYVRACFWLNCFHWSWFKNCWWKQVNVHLARHGVAPLPVLILHMQRRPFALTRFINRTVVVFFVLLHMIDMFTCRAIAIRVQEYASASLDLAGQLVKKVCWIICVSVLVIYHWRLICVQICGVAQCYAPLHTLRTLRAMDTGDVYRWRKLQAMLTISLPM